MLHAFIKFLKENELLQSEYFEYDTRLRIQKYGYLATKFGLDMGYKYSIYICGPYSEDMAEECYELFENPKLLGSGGSTTLPDSFDRDGFLQLVQGRDDDWLKIAVTLVDQQDQFTEDAPLIEHVGNIRYKNSKEFISMVLQDLHEYKMLDLVQNKLHA